MDSGLYLTHKPVGPAAFSVVQAMLDAQAAGGPGKRWAMCHGGALDPFAHGLMLVLVGPATKLFHHLHAAPKTYLATVEWGKETDSGDGLGAVVAQGEVAGLTPEKLDQALLPFLGWKPQVPPNHSNKRVDGERAWAKAQRGEAFELPPSMVFLHTAVWRSHAPRASVLEVTCRGGYYVRALARDLGRALGCRAHLSALHRTRIGPWADVAPGAQVRAPLDEVLGWLPTRVLSDAEWGALQATAGVSRGSLKAPARQLPVGFAPVEPPLVRALHLERLVGVLRDEGEQLVVEKLLLPPLLP